MKSTPMPPAGFLGWRWLPGTRTWGNPVVRALYLGFYFWFLTQFYLGKPFKASAGVVIISTGIPVYWILRRRR